MDGENGHSRFISLMFSFGDSSSLIFLNLFSTVNFRVRAQLETVFIPLLWLNFDITWMRIAHRSNHVQAVFVFGCFYSH